MKEKKEKKRKLVLYYLWEVNRCIASQILWCVLNVEVHCYVHKSLMKAIHTLTLCFFQIHFHIVFQAHFNIIFQFMLRSYKSYLPNILNSVVVRIPWIWSALNFLINGILVCSHHSQTFRLATFSKDLCLRPININIDQKLMYSTELLPFASLHFWDGVLWSVSQVAQ
jgi:hypothetical protein